MKDRTKQIVIIGIVFVVLVMSAVIFALTQKTEAPEVNQTNSQQLTTEKPSKPTDGKGAYRDYSPEAASSTTSQAVLFFYAPWCAQCRSIEKGIVEQGVPSGYDIFKVDYDSNQELREKYEIAIQSTFVRINESGEEIDKYVAYYEPTFETVVRNYLTQEFLLNNSSTAE